MNCKNCGAPLVLVWEKEFFLCEYCRTLHFPDVNKDHVSSLEKSTTTNCPLCQEPLVEALLDRTHVLHCTECKGILVDTFSFFPTILFIRSRYDGPELPLKPLPTDELTREILCPKCKQKMDTHPYAGPGNIVMDTCNTCSLNWLDYGEFYQIVNASGRKPRHWFW